MHPSYTLKQLLSFVAVAEASSIREAAARLHISESTLGSSLNQLEKALQTQLFVRKKAHGVMLTPSGHHLVSRARRLLREAALLQQEAEGTSGALVGRVSIGCPHGLAPTVLPPILAAVRNRHPGIAVDFQLGYRNELVPRLLGGQLDVIISPEGAHLTGVTLRRLYDAAVYVVLPHGHRLAGRATVPLLDLVSEPMVLLDVPESADHVLRLFNEVGERPLVALRSDNFELVRSLVGRGFGYSLQVQRPLGDQTYEGLQLDVRPLASRHHDQVISICWATAVRLSPSALAVVNCAVDHFSVSESAQSIPVAHEAPG